MAKPNPSPSTRFGAESGNNPRLAPGGKTKEQAQNEREAARIAAEVRLKILSAINGKIEEGQDPLEFLDTSALKLFKDSEDRAHGTPKQSMDIESPEGTLTPTVIERTIVKPDAK